MEFAGHRLPAGFAAWVHKKTGGTPLFMVDLLRYLVERRALVESRRLAAGVGRWPSSTARFPRPCDR